MLIIFISILLFSIFLGFYLKSKILLYFSLAIGLFTIAYTLYLLFFKKTSLNFAFTDDDMYIEDGKVDRYCGDDLLLPEGYDEFGSLHVCLKKGIGLGMGSSESRINSIVNKPPKPQTEHTYCGTNAVLPQGYDRFATRSECVRKGVGIGVRMPANKRQAFKDKAPRSMNKHEIYDLAHRFKIPTNQSRAQVLEQISNHVLESD
jgi:hypothetical protein